MYEEPTIWIAETMAVAGIMATREMIFQDMEAIRVATTVRGLIADRELEVEIIVVEEINDKAKASIKIVSNILLCCVL